MIWPTRAGIGLGIAGTGAVIFGRFLGAIEFYYLGAAGLIALFMAWLYVALSRVSLSVSRRATPSTLRSAQPVRIDLSLRNQFRRPTPILRVDDRVSDQPGPSIHLAPIAKESHADISYRIPSQRRGILALGPLSVTVTDPLGLFRSTLEAGRRTTMVVRPQLFDLGVLKASAGHDPTADDQRSQSFASGGDEFFALRPYLPGDELRRVDWRATARQDELIVRQDEKPRTGRITVILDRRSGIYDDDGFDRATSATTSVLHAARRGEEIVRFSTSAEGESVDIRSKADLDRVDEQLATIETTDMASLIRAVDRHRRVGQGGTMVIITGIASDQLNEAIERASRNYNRTITVICQRTAAEPAAGHVLYTGDDTLVESWHRAAQRVRATR